jgi:FdhD protein
MLTYRNATLTPSTRTLAEETPVAITYNRTTHAVMLATPQDLHDFAVGFSLSEGIIPHPTAIEDFTTVQAEGGIEARLWIAPTLMAALEHRRRRLAGATGCGLCGLESLEEATRPIPPAPPGHAHTPAEIQTAIASLPPAQLLNQATRAVHAAAFWTREEGLIACREDVGRHNALDKLAGHLALTNRTAAEGLVLLTSRISIELIQKAARMGAATLVAVSAPTARAVQAAEQSNLTLIGIARPDGFELFTAPHRLTP